MSDLTKASITKDLEWVTNSDIEVIEIPTSYVTELLAHIKQTDIVLKFISEMGSTSICECEGCSCDIEAMAEAARAARLPEEPDDTRTND